MRNESKLLRFLLRSPFPLVIFFIIPAALVSSNLLHFPLPFRLTRQMLLYNNVALLLFLGARALAYLYGLRRKIRYGAGARPAAAIQGQARPAAQLRERLAGAGFQLSDDGSYAEKPDRGYLGTLLIYAGLFLVLFIGTWENMTQFSGTLLHGIGIPADISKRGSYFPLLAGPMASPAGLPKLEVTKQVFASSTYPKGASDIVLWSKEGKPLGNATLVGSGDPYRHKGYDIYLAKQLVDVALHLKDKQNPDKTMYYDSVKLSPLWKKEGDYSMYGTFTVPGGLEGEAFYNPDRKAFKFTLVKEGKQVVDTEYVLYQYRSKEAGPYIMSLDALGNWSEIHVVRRRHMELLWVGGVIALIGLALRIAYRPQRVWLEEAPEGARVWTAGSEAKRLVEG